LLHMFGGLYIHICIYICVCVHVYIIAIFLMNQPFY
jgi:hypothetical protein